MKAMTGTTAFAVDVLKQDMTGTFAHVENAEQPGMTGMVVNALGVP